MSKKGVARVPYQRRHSPHRAVERLMHPMAVMEKLAVFLVSFALVVSLNGCSGENDTPTDPGRGALDVAVNPNPIVAMPVSGMPGTYDFPFEVVLTETGGRSVTITSMHVDVKVLGITMFSKTYDTAYLQGRNYSTVIPARSVVRYSFNPREEAPDAAFGSNVQAEIRIEGVDDRGNAVRKTTTVSIRRP